MILFGVIAQILIAQFEEPRFGSGSVGAKFFPSAVAAFIIILSVCLLIQAYLEKTPKEDRQPIISKASLLGVVFIVSYVVVMSFIGYLASTLLAFMIYLAVLKTKKISYYLIAATFAFTIYYIFGEVFFIALPQGSLLF